MSFLLKSLIDLPFNLTYIVTVVDDGGSSGKLRIMKDSPSPGDIRNVLAALAKEDSKLAEIFQYRFNDDNDLAGPTIGNMVLVAINEVSGELHVGLEELCRLLEIKGTVLSIVNDSV